MRELEFFLLVCILFAYKVFQMLLDFCCKIYFSLKSKKTHPEKLNDIKETKFMVRPKLKIDP